MPYYPCSSCQGPHGCDQDFKVGGMGQGGKGSLQGCPQVGQIRIGSALGKLAQSNRQWLWAHDLDRCGCSSFLDLSLAIRAVWHRNACMHRHKQMCTLHKGHVCDYALPQVCIGLSARPSALTSMLRQTMASATITAW